MNMDSRSEAAPANFLALEAQKERLYMSEMMTNVPANIELLVKSVKRLQTQYQELETEYEKRENPSMAMVQHEGASALENVLACIQGLYGVDEVFLRSC